MIVGEEDIDSVVEKNKNAGAGEMAAPAEGVSLSLSTHTEQLTTTWKLQLQGPDVLFWPSLACTHKADAHTHIHTNIIKRK